MLNELWWRARLLILLTGWLFSGIVAAVLFRVRGAPTDETELALQVWAIGFLALSFFSLWLPSGARCVRNPLRRREAGLMIADAAFWPNW